MTNDTPPRRFGALKIFLGSVIGAFLLFLATLGAIAYVAQQRSSQLFEAFLRRAVFGSSARGSFDRATLDVVRGRGGLEGLSIPGPGGTPLFQARSVEARFPWSWRGGTPDGLTIVLTGPSLRLNSAGDRPSTPLPSWAAPLVQEAHLKGIRFTDGAVELAWDPDLPPLKLEGLDGTWTRGDKGLWTLDIRGRAPSDPPATFSFKASFTGADGEADLTIQNLPWAFLAERLSAPGEDIRFLSGQIGIRSSATVREGRVTANPLVDIRGLRLEVPTEKKTFAGFSVKKVQQALNADNLSFTIPISGRWEDPRVSFSTALEQVLDNALRSKMSDDADRAKLARRGGAWLGAKADRAFKAWMERRKS